MPVPVRGIPLPPRVGLGGGRRRRTDEDDDDDDDEDDEVDIDGDDDVDDDDDEEDDEEDEDDDEDDDDDDDNDGEEAEGTANAFKMPTSVRKLRNLVTKLRARVQSLNNAARSAARTREEFTRARPAGSPEPTEEERQEAERVRVNKKTLKVVKSCEKYNISIVGVINRLGLRCTVEQLEELRSLGFLQREHFVSARSIAKKMKEEVLTAENSLEIRLRERISVRAFRRIRRILTEVQDPVTGEWRRFEMAAVPQHWSMSRPKDGSAKVRRGTDIHLKSKHLEMLGIYPDRPIYMPYPLRDDKEMRDCGNKVIGTRKLEVAIPSRDGFSGAAWCLLDSARDLFKRAAEQSNLRARVTAAADSALTGGRGTVRRLWVGADGLKWTARNGLVNWGSYAVGELLERALSLAELRVVDDDGGTRAVALLLDHLRAVPKARRVARLKARSHGEVAGAEGGAGTHEMRGGRLLYYSFSEREGITLHTR